MSHLRDKYRHRVTSLLLLLCLYWVAAIGEVTEKCDCNAARGSLEVLVPSAS